METPQSEEAQVTKDEKAKLMEARTSIMSIQGGHPPDVVAAHPEVNWKRGDTKIIWSRDNPDEVASAKKTFTDLVKKGFLAFRAVGKEGTKGEQIDEFDANAERLILIPQQRGG